MKLSALKVLLSGMVLTGLWFSHTPAWAGPPVDLIDFNSNGGDFTVVSTNDPGGPWNYDADTGSWRAFDRMENGVPFRSSRLNSPHLTVPNAGNVTLNFTHRYSFEVDATTRWDGGQLRLSVNQGPYETVPSSSFTVNGYNNTVGGTGVPACELVGQEAFTGQSTGYDTPEFISSSATLGPFNENDTISIQFLAAWDLNTQGLVPNWEIDSVEFVPSLEDRRPPPAFSDPALPANAAVQERLSHTLRVAAVGHVSVQWYKDMVAIPGANGVTYRISKMSPADVGQYFAAAINSVGSSTSRVAAITMIPDTTPPRLVSAEWCMAGEDIAISLSEPLRLDDGQGNAVTDQFTWFIEQITGPGVDPGQPAAVTYAAGDTTVFMTPEPGRMDPAGTYRVVLIVAMLDEAAAPNTLPADSSVPVECPQAISVGPAGVGPFTFDRPPRVTQFSTFVWTGQSRGVTDTRDTVNAKVQLLNASAISAALPSVAIVPPPATDIAYYWAGGNYLITSPTGVEGAAILANLRNDSGVSLTALGISYDLTSQFPVVEEVPGHLVYYSLSGTPNSWQQIPEISNDRTTGLKSANLDLSGSPWNVGEPLYILWADDNGSGTPDDANAIDNFAVTLLRPALSISYSNPNVIVTWPAGSGILQSKVSLDDLMWTDVPGAGSSGSATVAASGPHKFFTLRAP